MSNAPGLVWSSSVRVGAFAHPGPGLVKPMKGCSATPARIAPLLILVPGAGRCAPASCERPRATSEGVVRLTHGRRDFLGSPPPAERQRATPGAVVGLGRNPQVAWRVYHRHGGKPSTRRAASAARGRAWSLAGEPRERLCESARPGQEWPLRRSGTRAPAVSTGPSAGRVAAVKRESRQRPAAGRPEGVPLTAARRTARR